MKVLFVLPITEKYTGSPAAPLGAISLCTYLNRHGHETWICDRMMNYLDLEKELKDRHPDIVGISTVSSLGFADAAQIAELARAHSAHVVVGGVVASIMPESMLRNGIAELVSIGEGEISWLHIIEYYEGKRKIEDVGSVAYLKNGKMITNRRAPFLDLSELGVLDWSLVPVRKYFENFYGCGNGLHLYASKGCPGSCTFCFNPFFHLCKQRLRPIDDVIAEMKMLHEKYDMQAVYFADECFGTGREWIKEFCDKLRDSGLDIKWGCQTRSDVFGKEDYELMYSVGCRWVFIGIETGSPRMQKAVHKGLDLEAAAKSITAAYETGLNTVTAFIIALPGETTDDLRQTIDFAKKIKTSQYQINYYTPFARSAMYNNLPDFEKLHARTFDLKKESESVFLYKLQKNYSEVPTRDLKVVRAYFMWLSFWAKGSAKGSKTKHSFAVKTATDAIKNLFGHGVKFFFNEAFASAYQLMSVFFNRYFFPLILKKYNLK